MRFRVLAVTLLMLLPAVTSSAAFQTSVWVPPWDQAALTSMQNHVGGVSESNPVWYSWNADGSIATNWNAENATWRAAMTGSRFVPTVQNVVNKVFDGTLAATVVSTAASRELHASAIASLAIRNAYDGIDIDYERMPASSRAGFTAFVQLLASKLHAAGKTLSVTVYAKTSDSQNWSGPGAQDWAAIGAAADSVKIMAYDYHWSTSAAGAITPLDWLDKVSDYAASTLPHAKVFIALPWYGYDWVGTAGRGVSWQSATDTARAKSATITRDANGEATYTYADHTVFFQDAASYSRKADRIRSRYPGFGGIAHWAAGQEDPAIWNVLGGSVPSSGTSPTTPAAADFTVSGPSRLTVREGRSASAEYDVVAINGFSDRVLVRAIPVTPSPLGLSVTAEASATTNAVFRVSAPSGTAAGSYDVRLRFESGTLVREVTVTIVVERGPVKRRTSTASAR